MRFLIWIISLHVKTAEDPAIRSWRGVEMNDLKNVTEKVGSKANVPEISHGGNGLINL